MPALYLPLRRLRRADTVADAATQLVIEGYPRCGNTWAEMALRELATEPLRLAHHSHAAAHVIHAHRLRLPLLILFRAPEDAARSLLAMGSRTLTARDALDEYVQFYSAVQRLPHEGIVFASFDDVTERIGAVAAHLAARFDLPLVPERADAPEFGSAVFARMDARAAEIRPDRAARSQSNPTHFDASQTAMKRIAQEQIEALGDEPVRRRAHEVFTQMRSDIP